MTATHQSPAPLSLKKYRGVSGYLELESDWRELFRESGTTFPHHPTWCGAFLQAYESEPDSVVFYAFRVEGHLVAVIPLKKRRKSITKFRLTASYSAWELYYPDEMGRCDATIGYRPPSSLIDELLADLHKESGWDTLELLFLLEGSAFHSLLSEHQDVFVKSSHVSKYLEIAGDYESWMARYSKKFHRNLRRKFNNLLSKGNVRFDLVTEQANLGKAFEAFLQVEDSGWKGNDGTSIVKQPDKLDYYRRLLAGFGESGLVAIHLLWLDERCIGGQFGVFVGTTLFLLKIGYDESYSAESPGFLLVNNLIKEACQRADIKRISFVTSRTWMDVWKPWEEPVANAYCFNNTIKGRALGLAMRLYERFKAYRAARSAIADDAGLAPDDHATQAD